MRRFPRLSPCFHGRGKVVTPVMVAMCAALSAGCKDVVSVSEQPKEGQAAPKPSTTIGEPKELSQGIWSITIDVDVPTVGMTFVRTEDDPTVTTTSLLLSSYQHTFAIELQRALDAMLRRNMHCTVSALSVLHAREVWISHGSGGPMALPSGAIVILPCGGNEPLVKPGAPAPPMPH